jgi:hypothetical protein
MSRNGKRGLTHSPSLGANPVTSLVDQGHFLLDPVSRKSESFKLKQLIYRFMPPLKLKFPRVSANLELLWKYGWT